MKETDMTLAAGHQPDIDEITASITGPARDLWVELNTHIQTKWSASPRIAFSTCAGKPGWNVKYQKSGKSLCTLYPEAQGFVALVVIKLDLIPEVMAREKELTPYLVEMVANGKPYIGTLWLMIQVADERVLRDVKTLLELKTAKSRRGD